MTRGSRACPGCRLIEGAGHGARAAAVGSHGARSAARSGGTCVNAESVFVAHSATSASSRYLLAGLDRVLECVRVDVTTTSNDEG